jgi:hypothetical protein
MFLAEWPIRPPITRHCYSSGGRRPPETTGTVDFGSNTLAKRGIPVKEKLMLRLSLTTLAFAIALTAIATSASAASTYESVTLRVPVSVASMPIGTTVQVTCWAGPAGHSPDSPNGFAGYQVQATVPVQTVNGFVVYNGPPLVVVLRAPAGEQSAMVTGATVWCWVIPTPRSGVDPKKSIGSTSAVNLP